VHDLDWIQRHIAESERAQVVDVTNAYGVLGVMGPNSRALLQRVSDAELSNVAFPFATAQRIGIGQGTALALRITYVGELGWELHVPMGQMDLIYGTLLLAGREFGLVNAGHYAINSLRLEKGYRAWGADISPDDTPIEADLSFAVAWKKTVPFIGRDALLKQKQSGVKRRLVSFVLEDPEPVLWGSEPIYRNGEAVGYTTSGSYGHTLGAAVGMGYVKHAEAATADFIKSGRYDIAINGKSYRALPHLRSPYDPDRKRILI
jgi:4-methylaminobutanoate oxidase (formaldehyde-forming)